jgi:transposase
MGHVRGESRDQGALFPISLDELIPVDHLCRVIDAFVARLDLGQLGFAKASPAATGRPPYDPADLLKLYVYGYLQQVRSSRRLEAECRRNVEVMWLLGRLAPDHKTIAEFRRTQGEALRAACAAFVRFLRAAGVVGGEWVAIDGSKFRAAASRKAVPSVAALERQVGEYLAMLEQSDAAEGAVAVPAPEAIQAALAQLEQARQVGPGRALTEPEARLMQGTKGPAYNVQSAVDAKHGVIVAHAVTEEATDNRSLQPMAEAAREALAADTLKVVADAGYSNGAQVEALEQQGIEAHLPVNRSINNHGDGEYFDRRAFTYERETDRYRCPAGQWLPRKQLHRKDRTVTYAAPSESCAGCALKARCTGAARRLITRHLHDEALQTVAARTTAAHMRLRRETAERPFAELKWRIFGSPRFLLRGRRGAGTEMAIGVIAYNLKQALRALSPVGLIAALAS